MATAPVPATDPTVLDEVDRYLARAGVSFGDEKQTFWTTLSQRFGARRAVRLRALTEARWDGNPDPRIYTAKNASLDLSLFVTEYFLGATHRALLEKLVRLGTPSPRRIVDLGCDNGLVTCFLAYLYPGAHVVGLDICAAGLHCGRALAVRLGQTNVEFRRADLAGLLPRSFSAGTDLVVASLVYREVAAFPDDGETNEQRLRATTARAASYLRAVRDRLSADASFVSLERFGTADCAEWWEGVLESAGLRVDNGRSSDLDLGCGCARRKPKPRCAPCAREGGCPGTCCGGVCGGACGTDPKSPEQRAETGRCSGCAGAAASCGKLDLVQRLLRNELSVDQLLGALHLLAALEPCPVCLGAIHRFLVARRL